MPAYLTALNNRTGWILKTTAATDPHDLGARALTSGSKILTYEPGSSAYNHKFLMQSDCSFLIQFSGNCIAMGSGTGTALSYGSCTPSASNKFILTAMPDAKSAIPRVKIALADGRCLDMAKGAIASGSQVVGNTCNGADTQGFYVPQATIEGDGKAGTFEPFTYNDSATKVTFVYRLMKPDGYDPSKSYPLVIWFHGAGSSGMDNNKQMGNGEQSYNSPYVRGRFNAFVLVPQHPNGDWATLSASPPKEQTALMNLVAGLKTQNSIDAKRIYVTGLSAGGYGAWEFSQRFPTVFAAFIEFSGGGTASTTARIAAAGISGWAIHGQDQWSAEDRGMVNAMKAAGGDITYTDINANLKGGGHGDWPWLLAQPDLIEWLFSHHKP
jgi:predicted esterase